jgi:hypothetical protein
MSDTHKRTDSDDTPGERIMNPQDDQPDADAVSPSAEDLTVAAADERGFELGESRGAFLLRLARLMCDVSRRAPAILFKRVRAFAARNSLLLVILGIAALLRFWGITFGYPGKYRPDEEYLISRAMGFHLGDLNPHFFIYPTLYMYMLSAVFGVVRVIGDGLGIFGAGGFEDFLNRFHYAPAHIIARATTASLGVVGVWAAFLLGRIAYGRTIGLLAAGILAVNFSHVRESHFATTDVPMTLLLTLAFAELVKLVENGRMRHYASAGLLIGLATTTKYSAAAALVPLIVAGALRALADISSSRIDVESERPLLKKTIRVLGHRIGALAAAGACSALAFALGSPYLFFDTATVRENFAYQLPFVQKGVSGLDIPLGFAWLLKFGLPQAAGTCLTAFFIVAILVVLFVTLRCGPRRDAPALLLVSFVIALCIPYVRTRWIFLRYVVPLMPVMAVLVAAFVAALASHFLRAKQAPLAAVLILGLASIGPAYRAALTSRMLAKTDTRQLAREWIEKHVPRGSDIAIHRAYVYGKPELPHGYHYVDIAQSESLLAHWALVDDSPIRFYSPPLPESAVELLHERGRLREKFDPFIPGLASRAVFDPADAFYLPVSGIQSMRRPGPVIWIYEVAESPPRPMRSDCGLLGRYYPNTRWQGNPELVRIDPYLIFSWESTFPVSTPLFSAEWIGRIEISTAGRHAFRLESDDGSTLEIDGRLVVDNGGMHQPVSVSGVVRLDPGLHAVRLRYANDAFTGALRVFWTPPDGSERVLDCETLHPPPSTDNARAPAPTRPK